MSVKVKTDVKVFQDKYDSAIVALKNNTIYPFKVLDKDYPMPILRDADSCYIGTWLEVAPQSSLLYGQYYDFDIAKSGHELFYDTQNEEGQFPFAVFKIYPSYAHVQEVLPLAETGFDVYKLTKDAKFLEKTYNACSKMDAWMTKYRDSRGLDLAELFCEFDTGHDNSNRFWACNYGMNRTCPPMDKSKLPEEVQKEYDNNPTLRLLYGDARKLHRVGSLPWLAPDMSATKYGTRKALAKIAREMGKINEADEWEEKAEKTRIAILTYLFDPETLCFYDLDINNKFIRIVTDACLRVLCEHVVDNSLFEKIFKRHIINPTGFWPEYPLPPVAISDPLFSLTNDPDNNWGGHCQPLMAQRAPRYMEYYGKYSEMTHVMKKYMESVIKADGFRQQFNPFTGEASGIDKNYTPAMTLMVDFTARLYGVRKEEESLEWNCRKIEGSKYFIYSNDMVGKKVQINTENDISLLIMEGKELFKVQGVCRIITDMNGNILNVIGTEMKEQEILITRIDDGKVKKYRLMPNQKLYNIFEQDSNL